MFTCTKRVCGHTDNNSYPDARAQKFVFFARGRVRTIANAAPAAPLQPACTVARSVCAEVLLPVQQQQTCVMKLRAVCGRAVAASLSLRQAAAPTLSARARGAMRDRTVATPRRGMAATHSAADSGACGRGACAPATDSAGPNDVPRVSAAAERLHQLRRVADAHPAFTPYPHGFRVTHTVAAVVGQFAERTAAMKGEATPDVVRLSARVLSKRAVGKMVFFDVRSGGTQLQVVVAPK